MISGLVLKYLNGECFVIRRGYETTLPVSSSFCLTVPIGFTRETFIEQAKANVLAELDAADAEKSQAVPVNPNLVGAV